MRNSIILGGGCFWCTQAVFENLQGVTSVKSGYMGGDTLNPTYEDICRGDTNHIEVIKVDFEEDKISLENILDIFFTIHDPTSLNRQGNDVGVQYKSIIFYFDDKQKGIIFESLEKAQKNYNNNILTEVKKAEVFYIAEDYHQEYFKKNPKNPYCNFAIPPKLEKLEKYYKEFMIK